MVIALASGLPLISFLIHFGEFIVSASVLDAIAWFRGVTHAAIGWLVGWIPISIPNVWKDGFLAWCAVGAVIRKRDDTSYYAFSPRHISLLPTLLLWRVIQTLFWPLAIPGMLQNPIVTQGPYGMGTYTSWEEYEADGSDSLRGNFVAHRGALIWASLLMLLLSTVFWRAADWIIASVGH